MIRTFWRHQVWVLTTLMPGKPFHRFRTWLWRTVGFEIDPSVIIRPSARIVCPSLKIGAETTVNIGTLLTGGHIEIGRRCDIAPNVTIHAGSHEMGDANRRAGRTYAGKIVIGDGNWIGTGVTILEGARIGNGCLIAAGSVVTAGDYDDNVLLAGVPAKVKKAVRQLSAFLGGPSFDGRLVQKGPSAYFSHYK